MCPKFSFGTNYFDDICGFCFLPRPKMGMKVPTTWSGFAEEDELQFQQLNLH
jgi:hypothetical protein